MAKSAAERRATRKRKEQERGRRRPSVPGDARGRANSDDLIGHLVVAAAATLLFTSLLVQATRAMAATGRAGGGRSRSPSFRRAFLTSYAVRIGERLTEAREHAVAEAARGTGRDLVPVLRKRDQAVDDVFARMFPETYGTEGRAYDARGWHAGRLAADSADLGTGREQLHA